MTAYTHNTNIIDGGTSPIYSLVGGDTLSLSAGSSIVQTANKTSNSSASIRATGTTTVTNAGYVVNVGNAIHFENTTGTLTLNNSGFLKGGSAGFQLSYIAAVHIEEGGASITNTGQIVNDFGHAIVNASSSTSLTTTITNSGLIASYAAGVAAIATTWVAATVVNNSGTIYGGIGFDKYTSTFTSFQQAPLTLTNTSSGSIIGAINRVTGSETLSGSKLVADTITNAGTIVGDVSLGKGIDSFTNSGTVIGNINLGIDNDTYTATGTGSVKGYVAGGFGNDTLTGSYGQDLLYGDNASGDTTGGSDILSGGYGDDVLYGGYGTDILYGNQDNDILYGNQDADILYGGQGNDVLYGGQGADVLYGNLGDDALYGNLGDDVFVFTSGFGQDRIGDLSNVSGNTDLIRFGPGTFANFAAVQAGATDQAGGVLLTDSGGNTVFIVGYTAASLTAPQFAFG